VHRRKHQQAAALCEHDIENMCKLLTIEKDELVAQSVVSTLKANGFTVDLASTGGNGMKRATDGTYDAVILGRELPDLDGITVVTALRRLGIHAPMLMMSSACNVEQTIEGLRAGADDYISIPFSLEEMLVRVEVLLRRRPVVRGLPAVAAPRHISRGELELDLVRRTVNHQNKQIDLRDTEFRLLELMMTHTGRVLTRATILDAIWDRRFDSGTNVIDVQVANLRQKLNSLGVQPIRTIRGAGYRFG
jgi:two-component system, OmpR family, response regulator